MCDNHVHVLIMHETGVMKTQASKTQISDLRPRKLRPPEIKKSIYQTLKKKLNSSSVELLYGHPVFTDIGHNGARYLSSSVYRRHVDQTVKNNYLSSPVYRCRVGQTVI